MYVVTVTFVVKPEFVESFRLLVRKQSENSLTREADCHRFDVSFDPDDPARCFLYELYTDRAAFDAHVTTPHFAEFGAAIEGGIESKELNCWVLDEA